MSGWKNIEFNELAKVQGGFAFKSDDYEEEGVLLVRIGNLQHGMIGINNSVYIKFQPSIHKNFVLRENDILIGMTGDLGKIAKVRIIDLPALLNQRVGRFIPSLNTDIEFLYQLISSKIFQEKLKLFFEGGAQANISPKQIESVKVFVPSTNLEQTQIAQILSKTDQAIEQTEKLIAKYQRIKTGLMQDLLTKGIDEKGNIRSEKTHRFKTENGFRVPEEWEVNTLDRYCFIHNNLRKPISSLERFEKKGIYPYYGATGVIDYIDEYRVNGKYVLIGEDGDHFLKFTKQNMTHLVNGKFNVSNHAHILSGNDKCMTEWIHYFFCNRDITFYLTRQGAGRFKLNKAALLNLPMYLPSKKEQIKIVERIIAFEKQFKNIYAYREKLQSLKTGLMKDLLSGKVRVNVKSPQMA
jgi:type I restriction enzyme S subunit